MSIQLKPLEICCDAPPYSVVEACEWCGFDSPLDVPWWRLSRLFNGEVQHNSNFFRLWRWLFGRSRPKKYSCICGQPLHNLKYFAFNTVSQKGDYLIGQCHRCRTIFWDATVPVPAWLKEDVFG